MPFAISIKIIFLGIIIVNFKMLFIYFRERSRISVIPLSVFITSKVKDATFKRPFQKITIIAGSI